MTDSHQLLAEYVLTGSETGFRELVSRYVNLVYSTALRLVDGDTHRAEDVAQTVFADLARTARTLPENVMLGGWLHRHTCFIAANAMRAERRRQWRERQAVEMNALQEGSVENFSRISPILDEAINELGEADRTAIVLRFFEQRDFQSVADALGSKEDAARMRVNRALGKLELLLKRRGVTTTAATLAMSISANAVLSAPGGLSAAISGCSLAGTTVASTTTAAITKAIAMTTLHKTILATTLAVAIAVGVYQTRQASNLRDEVATLQRSQASGPEQIERLRSELAGANNRLGQVQRENEQLKRDAAEVFKLRGEVSRQRAESQAAQRLQEAGGTSEVELRSWLSRVKQLKDKVDASADMQIPEMRFLREIDWLQRAKYFGNLDDEQQFRAEFAELRRLAKMQFGIAMGKALREYAAANEQRLPADLGQLKPFLPASIDDSILQRYEMFRTGTLGKDIRAHFCVLREREAVDPVFDDRLYISPNNSPRLVSPFHGELNE